MPRPSKNKTQTEAKNEANDLINALDINVSSTEGNHATKSIVGKKVSLNLKMEQFFGVGPFRLNKTQYCAKIPDNLTVEETLLIKEALFNGLLLEGEVYVNPNVKDKTVPNEYWDYIKKYGLEPDRKHKAFQKINHLMRYGSDRGWTLKEITKYCIQQEKIYKSRPRVLKLLNEVLVMISGVENIADQ